MKLNRSNSRLGIVLRQIKTGALGSDGILRSSLARSGFDKRIYG